MVIRGGFRAAATSKLERFVIIVNGWKPLTIITKRSILDVAAILDPPLLTVLWWGALSRKSEDLFCPGLLSTNVQLVEVFLDVTTLYYNPDFSQKCYFVFLYIHPPGYRTFIRLMFVQFMFFFQGGCEETSKLALLNKFN